MDKRLFKQELLWALCCDLVCPFPGPAQSKQLKSATLLKKHIQCNGTGVKRPSEAQQGMSKPCPF
eukprot:2598250-Amphidinium_carterae.4